MKTSARLTLLATLLAGFGMSSALAATASGTANANVLTPITIAAGTALNFGTLSANAGGGTVVITPAGARSATGTVIVTAVAPFSAAAFTVTGTGAATFAVTYPASFNVTSGANTMGVVVTGAATGALVAGTLSLPVGGTLTVAANQAAGGYTGTYTMTVEYN